MRNRGFTAIEILMVMIIIGVLAAFGIPRLRNSLEKQNVRSAKALFATLVAALFARARAPREAVVLLPVLFVSLIATRQLPLFAIAALWDRRDWADHPLLRILCEQPAIWAVPLAITLMIVVSKLTTRTLPQDIRMKMLVLHAPEQLGLKQESVIINQVGKVVRQ